MEGFLGLEEMDGAEFEAIARHGSTNEESQPQTTSRVQKSRTILPNDAETPRNGKARRKAVKSSSSSMSDQEKGCHDTKKTNSTFAILPENSDIDLPAWETLGLSDNILRSLQKLQFSNPTPIQELAIPLIMSGEDVIGKASTGSGKTLAFGIPVIEHVLHRRKTITNEISALILAPTRELAQQISQHLEAVCQYAGVQVANITGGLSVEKQLRKLQYNPDVVVATPGRLWDILSTKEGMAERFSHVSFLILDEADRILQQGHFQEVSRIIEQLGSAENRQTLVFSATFQRQLQAKLSKGMYNVKDSTLSADDSVELLLRNLSFRNRPRFIDADPDSSVARAVQQCIIEVAPLEKDYYLYYFLLKYSSRSLIFTNSIGDVHRLVRLLQLLGLPALGLHSNKQQKARLKAVERFRAEPNAILVASDVAARGLDIASVDIVLHYHLPQSADLYVHRSGRTARGGLAGLSVLLCSSSEVPMLRKLQKALEIKEFKDFPVETNQLGAIKPKVNIARQIIKIEDDSKKSRPGVDSWLAEAAEDLGVDLDDTHEDVELLKQNKSQLQALRARLSAELKKPVKSGSSGRYLTRNGGTLAASLLSGKAHKNFIGTEVRKASDMVTSKSENKK